jgi:hypothetical protein
MVPDYFFFVAGRPTFFFSSQRRGATCSRGFSKLRVCDATCQEGEENVRWHATRLQLSQSAACRSKGW